MSPEAQQVRDAPRSPLRKSSNGVLVVAAIAVVAGGLWFLFGRGGPAETATVVSAEPGPAAAGDAATAPPEPATPPAPADLRGWLEAASPNPAWRAWLAAGDLLERCAGIIENVATGQSPRAHVPFLRPATRFSTDEVGGRQVIAPASYARYDAVADAIASLDAGALARAYRLVHGALDAAYAALGYPRGALDRATARALDRVLAAPVLDRDVAVLEDSGMFVLEDPTLERLGEVEKHLLRMGPRNTRLLQAKARELRGALGLSAPVAPASAKGR